MKKSLFYTVFISAFLLSACTSILEYHVKRDTEYDPEFGYTAYDKENGLRWLVNYNETHVIIHMDTDNEATMFKMLYGGLNVYFDPIKARGQSYSLKYPLSRSLLVGQMGAGGADPLAQNKKISVDDLIDALPPDAIFMGSNGKERFPASDTSKITVDISLNENGRLFYYASIPHSELGLERRKEGAKGLYMGIVSEAIRTKSSKNYFATYLPQVLKDTEIWFKVIPKQLSH